ncbi:MAG: hypothetical protein FJ130_02155 [Deltaproteobacteria bacterium]|nr:hypothetical protein [Deltaproteobacteria bacterium]
MRQAIFKRKAVYFLFALLLLIIMVCAGCRSTLSERKEEPVKREDETVGKYYHFEDVRVPRELNYKQSKSFVYETPRFKTGVLLFAKWRLDAESLIDFFNHHMERDNWKLVNSFKGKESILNFSKPDKTCTIKITEKWHGTTEVEIRVGPLGEKKM